MNVRDLLERGLGDTRPSGDALKRTLERARRQRARRRVGSAALALVVFAAGGTFAWRAFRRADAPTIQPGPYHNGRILFSAPSVTTGWGSHDLFLVDPAGGPPVNLTNGHEQQFLEPAWSPDGSRIAFLLFSQANGNEGIWVMDADGSNRYQLTHGTNAEYPTWSPDGRQIAFSWTIWVGDRSDRGSTASWDLYAVDATGGEPRAITTDPDSNDFLADWSPDGSTIAFSRLLKEEGIPRTPMGRIYTVDATGGSPHPLTERWSSNPSWSPNGKLIAFTADWADPGNPDIYVMRVGDGSVDRLTDDADPESWPDWSPDGTRIVFVRHTEPGAAGAIITMAADGSDERIVYESPMELLSPPRWEPVPGPAEPSNEPSATATSATPSVDLRPDVVCEPGRVDVVDAIFEAEPDGVHIVFENRTDVRVLAHDQLRLEPGQVAEVVVQVPPGPARTYCYPESRAQPRAAEYGDMEVRDPDGMWVLLEVECLPGEGLGSSDWDYAPGTVGTPGTPEDAVREQIPWLRPDDALDRAGYPKADPPRVRILREGRAFGIVTLQSDGQGGWLVETVDRCYA